MTGLLFNHYYRSIGIISRLRSDSPIILWFDLDFWNFIRQLCYSYFYYAHDPNLPLKHQLWVPKWNGLIHILQIHVLKGDLTSNSHVCILLDQTGYIYCHMYIGDVTPTSREKRTNLRQLQKTWSEDPWQLDLPVPMGYPHITIYGGGRLILQNLNKYITFIVV